MSEHIRRTIDDLRAQIARDEQKLIDDKRMVNRLADMAGLPQPYPDAESAAIAGAASLTIRPDQFYGQPLASCIRQVLEMRKALNQGPATVNEIYAALSSGGFAFDTKNEENAKRGLRVSISKNTAVFHKLPGSGRIGLREWYPNVRSPRTRELSDDRSEREESEEEAAESET